MGLETIAAVALGLGAASAGYSAYSQKRAGDKAEGQFESAQEEARAAQQRKYEANMEDFTKRKGFLETLIEDPTSHPEWEPFKSSIEEQTTQSTERMKDVFRRRGVTGGALAKALADLEQTKQTTLEKALIQIGHKSREDLSLLQKPYLGQEWVPGNYGITYPSFNADVSGYGDLAGTLYTLNKEKEEDEVPASSLEEAGSLSKQGTYPSETRYLDQYLRMLQGQEQTMPDYAF